MKNIQTHNYNLEISPFCILLIKLFNICLADSSNTYFALIKRIKTAIYVIQKRAIYFAILLHCHIHFKICTKNFVFKIFLLSSSPEQQLLPIPPKKNPKIYPFL